MNNEDDYIRVLAVRQPWASLIIEGLKTIEVRSRNTNIRGQVAIYAGQHVPSQTEIDWVAKWFDSHYENPMELIKKMSSAGLGQVLGTVEITDSKECGAWSAFNDTRKFHWNVPIYYSQFLKNKKVFWHLKNPVKFVEPVKLEKWPSGGPWAKVPKSILPEIGKSEMLKAVEEKRM